MRNGDTIPCDCLLLDGFCTINESDLTGESSIVMKSCLASDNRDFNYEYSKKSILFFGTKLFKCESVNNLGEIKVMAISTGFNTNRGNLIQNLLFPKNTNFKFYNDIKLFIYLMAFVWIIVIIFRIILYVNSDAASLNKGKPIKTPLELVQKILDDLTIIIPPILPICMTFTSFYFHMNLNIKNISCISDKRMNAAGRSNIIVLDKTGTLTEEGLELYGFQTTHVNTIADMPSLQFLNIETDAKVFNIIYKDFYRRLCLNPNNPIFDNYLTNPQNNLIYYLECLACCHSIDKIKDDILGNSIDLKIFEHINWIQEKSTEYSGEFVK
jgi:cation-transporting ATPase 13A3/4/5